MEYMDLLPPTAPSLVFARETCRPYWLCVTWKDFDECDNDPCMNGGECMNGDNNYTCKCMPGYAGTNCETGTQIRFFYKLCYLSQLYDHS